MPGFDKDKNSQGVGKDAVTVQLTLNDFDDSYTLDEFPEDFECQLCMMVKEDMVECPQCWALSCKDCNIAFTTKNKSGSPNQNKFECTICHKVNVFNPQNKIMKDIQMNLMF